MPGTSPTHLRSFCGSLNLGSQFAYQFHIRRTKTFPHAVPP